VTELGGPVAGLLASIGAIAAGGAFIGTAFALVTGHRAGLGRSQLIERIGEMAAATSVIVVAVALIEEVVT
jgi:hypothetical protein